MVSEKSLEDIEATMADGSMDVVEVMIGLVVVVVVVEVEVVEVKVEVAMNEWTPADRCQRMRAGQAAGGVLERGYWPCVHPRWRHCC